MKGTIRVPKDSGRHDVPRNTASSAKVSLLWHVDIDDVLIRAK